MQTKWGYWCDTRDASERATDTFFPDNPLSGGQFYLGRGHDLLARWSGGKWKQGNLLGPGGDDPNIKRKTATYAPDTEWDRILDPRVATSTGHIIVKRRPMSVAPGWGGYDVFTKWQASGRHVHRRMMNKPVDPVTDFRACVPFTGSGGEPGPTVWNQVPDDVLPKARQDKALYAVVSKKGLLRQVMK